MTTYNHIRAALLDDGEVLSLTLAVPKGNVLSMAMMTELVAALTKHRDDVPLKAVLLCADGRHFSYGASVAEHRRDNAEAMLETFHHLVRQMVGYSVPIVAMVQGRCLGGAFEVALCCHVVLAMRNAIFACPEISLGVFPPVLAAIGHLRLGGALAEQLLLTGDELSAEAAHRCGLVTHIYSETNEVGGEAVDPHAAALAWVRDKFGPRSAFSLRQATRATRDASGLKAQVAGVLDAVEKQYIEELLQSHDGNEGIEAFLEQRVPVWRHA